MAIPSESAAVLKKVSLADLVIGIGMLVVGATEGPSVLMAVGIALALAGAGMFFFARSQEAPPDGPIS